MSIARHRIGTLLAATLAITVAVSSASSPHARAQDPNVDDAISQQQQMESELARQRAQLAELRRDQADLNVSLAALTTDLSSVGLELERALFDLERLTASLEKSRADLARYGRQIVNLEEDLVELAAEIGVARDELRSREGLLEEHLRTAYEQSQTSILEVILSTESFGAASSKLSYMLTLSEEDKRLADEIRELRDRLEIRRQTLRDGRETLGDLRDAEAERAAALDAQQAKVDAARQALEEKQRQLEELQTEQRAQLAAAERAEHATEALIADHERALEGQRVLVEELKERARELDIAYRGRFAWPERGEFLVTQEFGRTRFNANHTGIDLSYHVPRCGGPIYAAGDGVVLADERPNIRYGDTAIGVVIGHSQRLQTWYWHLSRELVSPGQEVSAGELIGYEGATGYATGCHLHFEILLDGTPQSPRRYLP